MFNVLASEATVAVVVLAQYAMDHGHPIFDANTIDPDEKTTLIFYNAYSYTLCFLCCNILESMPTFVVVSDVLIFVVVFVLIFVLNVLNFCPECPEFLS